MLLIEQHLKLIKYVTLFELVFCLIAQPKLKFCKSHIIISNGSDEVSLSIRLGSARGKKSKSGWQGKLLKLRVSGRKKKRLVKEQHVKLLRKRLY